MKKEKSARGLTRKLLISLGIPTVFVPGLILAAVLGWDWKGDLRGLRGERGFRGSEVVFPEKGMVSEVLDGDTFVLESGQTVRLLGINAPDRGEQGYEEAKEYLQGLVEGEEIGLEYDAYQDDKFGRILAYVFESCQTELGCQNRKRMVNWLLVKREKAKVVIYEDRRKLKYEKELLEAEGE